MLGRNGNTAYVRYNSQGRIVAGGPIISPIKPKNGNWIAVSNVLGTNTTGTNGNILRAFIRLDMFGRVVPSSLVIQTKEPLDANSGTGWIELNAIYRCSGTTTTTTSSSSTTTTTSSSTSTTTSTTSSTTSTTTTMNPYSRYSFITQESISQQWFYKYAYTGIYENAVCNQTILWFSTSTIGIGTRVYYDSAYTSPLVQPFNILIATSTTSVSCTNVPGTLTVYTIDTNGYIIADSLTVDDYSYRLYIESTGGSWNTNLSPFTTDCTQYFNTAITVPTVNSISVGTTVYSSLGPAAHDPNFEFLSYSGNVYSVATNGVVTGLLTNCGGTTTTTSTSTSTSTTTTSTTTTIAPSPMILTFNIATNGGSLTLPYDSGSTPTGTIYWGDGSSSANTYVNRTHVYATAGNYDVTLDGTGPTFNFGINGTSTNRGQLRDIKQWGTFIQTSDWDRLFQGCGNLTGISATDNPYFGSATTLNGMFNTCSNLGTTTTNMNSWDVSGITDMYGMFLAAFAFNANIGNWNTSNVTNMSQMFADASVFNQNIGGWNTGSVTDMSFMFNSATAFNQNIGSWNVSNVLDMNNMFAFASSFNQSLNSWNVGNVANMLQMFAVASSFNGNIASWNVISVTNMSGMFNSNSAFNQNISGWNVSNVTNMSTMFTNASSFNQNLSGWCVTNIPTTPTAFSSGASAWSLPKPIWGTCPP